MPYKSIVGKLFGIDTDTGHPMVKGAVWGGSTPTGYGRGKTIYVDSNVAGSDGTSPASALATLDSAFDKVAANQGDVIVVMPGHSETITGAGGIAHDVAGVAVVGLGYGAMRPTFLMDGATSVTYLISAASAFVSNLLFKSGHSNVVTCISVGAADAWVDKCEFRNNTTNEDFLTCINSSAATDNLCDGLKVSRCYWHTIDTDDAAFITLTGAIKRLFVEENIVVTASATAAQLISLAAGKLSLGTFIRRNFLSNAMTAGELFFSNDGSTNTGIAVDNYCAHLDTTTTHDLGLESSGIAIFNLWSTSTIALQGGVVPAADVNN